MKILWPMWLKNKKIASRTVHENLMYSCDQCEKQFTQNSNLLRHREVIHGICAVAFMHEGLLDPIG